MARLALLSTWKWGLLQVDFLAAQASTWATVPQGKNVATQTRHNLSFKQKKSVTFFEQRLNTEHACCDSCGAHCAV